MQSFINKRGQKNCRVEQYNPKQRQNNYPQDRQWLGQAAINQIQGNSLRIKPQSHGDMDKINIQSPVKTVSVCSTFKVILM